VPWQIADAMLIEHMRWTWQEFESQPLWLIDTLRIKMEEDGKYQKAKIDEAERKSKNRRR
jgi:hypothetical protein